MRKGIYIIGAGSVGGHVALNLSDYTDDYHIEGFLDDDPNKIGTEQYGYPVLGDVGKALELGEVAVVIGVAFPATKRRILERMAPNGSLHYPTLVHDRAWISKEVHIGRGCIIYPGTTINYGSDIEDFVVINMNCALGHHTRIGAYSSLAPGVNTGGHTHIEDEVEMGIGAATLQQVRIGKGSIVGGQSMVIRGVEPGTTVVGVPSRAI